LVSRLLQSLAAIRNSQSTIRSASSPPRGEQLVAFLPQRFHVGLGQGRIELFEVVAVGARAAERI
jgi:hypothetical protein